MSPPRPISRVLTIALGCALVVGHLLGVAALARDIAFTTDEPGYLLAGHAIVTDWNFATPQERLQGPLGFVANQSWIDPGTFDSQDLESVRVAGRLGMLPFAACSMLAVWWFAHAAFGAAAGLFALALAAVCPMLLGNAALVTVDTAWAATTVAMLGLLWAWRQRPTLPRLVAWSVALGLSLATKYLALIVAAMVPIYVLVATCRRAGFDVSGRAHGLAGRLAWAMGALVVAGLFALLTLHACYGFAVPRFDLDASAPLQSSPLQKLAGLPLLGRALELLPEPMVVGADYQAAVSRDFSSTFRSVASAHPLYFVMALATKTALPALAAWLCGVFAARGRGVLAVVMLPLLGLLGYLSLVSNLQIGIRYVLPWYPVFAVIAAGFWRTDRGATSSMWTRPTGPRFLVGIALLALACAVTWRAWPHCLGYFNPLIGGPAGAHRWYLDSNTDWGQNRVGAARDAIALEHQGVAFLRGSDGPRFGLVAVYIPDLARIDVEQPGRLYHWLMRFAPIDHHATAWLVFRIAVEDFELAARRDDDPRAWRDLALAFVRDGDLRRARDALRRAASDAACITLADELLDQLDVLAMGGAQPTDAAAVRAARRRALQISYSIDRADLAFRLLRDADHTEQAELFAVMWASGEPEQAVELLRDRESEGLLTAHEALLLAGGLFHLADFAAARDVLSRHQAPADDDPLMPLYRTFRTQVEEKYRAMERLQQPRGEQSGSPRSGSPQSKGQQR